TLPQRQRGVTIGRRSRVKLQRRLTPGIGRAKASPASAQEEAEVIAGGGEHGIDAIAVAPLQIIAAANTVLGLGMADDWFDGGSRRSSRRMGLVTRRTWPLIQTRNFSL